MKRDLILEEGALVLRQGGAVQAREAFTPAEGSLEEALGRLLKSGVAAIDTARIASCHARMLLLPWVPQLTTAERWGALATSRFEQAYGDAPADWVMRVADDTPPRSRLVAALPAPLLRALNRASKPRSIVIGLLEAVGALLARERAFHGCVAEMSPTSASLLMICHGELRRVRCRRFENLEEVSTAVRSEWATACASEIDRGGRKTSAASQPAITLAMMGGEAGTGVALASALGSSRVLNLA